jgi:hypothetical protein
VAPTTAPPAPTAVRAASTPTRPPPTAAPAPTFGRSAGANGAVSP